MGDVDLTPKGVEIDSAIPCIGIWSHSSLRLSVFAVLPRPIKTVVTPSTLCQECVERSCCRIPQCENRNWRWKIVFLRLGGRLRALTAILAGGRDVTGHRWCMR